MMGTALVPLGKGKGAGLKVAPRVLQSLSVAGAGAEPPKPGEAVTVAIFPAGERGKITGGTKGGGFQGGGPRPHFRGGPGTPRNTPHPKPRSIAPGTHPPRILKGKRTPGP